MFERDLRNAETTMLKGGMAPRYVRRTLRELRDHHADLRAALIADGMPAARAEREAC